MQRSEAPRMKRSEAPRMGRSQSTPPSTQDLMRAVKDQMAAQVELTDSAQSWESSAIQLKKQFQELHTKADSSITYLDRLYEKSQLENLDLQERLDKKEKELAKMQSLVEDANKEVTRVKKVAHGLANTLRERMTKVEVREREVEVREKDLDAREDDLVDQKMKMKMSKDKQ